MIIIKSNFTLFKALKLAPLLISSSTVALSFNSTAMCNGVLPFCKTNKSSNIKIIQKQHSNIFKPHESLKPSLSSAL